MQCCFYVIGRNCLITIHVSAVLELVVYHILKPIITLTLCLGRFDERISTFAERKFQRDGIEVLTGCRVVSVSDKFINMKVKATAENVKVPHGMVVWSTGVGTRPVVTDFMEQIGQVPSFYIPFA